VRDHGRNQIQQVRGIRKFAQQNVKVENQATNAMATTGTLPKVLVFRSKISGSRSKATKPSNKPAERPRTRCNRSRGSNRKKSTGGKWRQMSRLPGEALYSWEEGSRNENDFHFQ
jgi:hypothetical protein